MPIVTVQFFEGRTIEQKRKIAAALTDVLAETAGCSKDSIEVLFQDVAKSDWAKGGTLFSDMKPGQ